METRRQRRERERKETKLATQLAKASAVDSKDRFNEFLGLVSFACTLASWGWTAVAPASSAIFGSILLLIAVVAMLLAIRRMWSMGNLAWGALAFAAILGITAFDWHIVIKPQRGKPFQELLVHGYYLTTECGSLRGPQEMPTWMRDESKAWQAGVQQLISDKLPAKDSQIWEGAIILGRLLMKTGWPISVRGSQTKSLPWKR